MRLVILGAPGSGKGTQGQRLSSFLKVPEISTGDILRAAVAAKTPLGRAAKTVMDAGQLVSDEIVLGVLRERLQQADVRKGFIIDGFPRNSAQAEALDELLGQIGQPLDLALVINVGTDWLLQRMVGRRTCRSCGAVYNIYTAPPKLDESCDECGGRLKQRADDNEETIGTRLRIYETQTAPVISRYQEQGRMRAIQGAGSIEDVFKAVLKVVEEEKNASKTADRSAAIRNAVARQKTKAGGTKQLSKSTKPASKAAVKKKVVKKKTAPKKKVATKKKITAKKKTVAKKAVKKKTVSKKTAAVKKPANKKAASKKKVTAKKSAAKSSKTKTKKTGKR
ncbi:MAG: adenylate kinase [Gammaproteobacteria bacterium]